jgi:hypothetical protein
MRLQHLPCVTIPSFVLANRLLFINEDKCSALLKQKSPPPLQFKIHSTAAFNFEEFRTRYEITRVG